MSRLFLAVSALVALYVVGSAAPDRAARTSAGPGALEAKLHGEWDGAGPCDGGLTFRGDGTYERMHEGPGGIHSAGTWKVRWDALPPTLVLTCRESDDPNRLGKVTNYKLVELDDESLALASPDPDPSKPTRFSRAMK